MESSCARCPVHSRGGQAPPGFRGGVRAPCVSTPYVCTPYVHADLTRRRALSRGRSARLARLRWAGRTSPGCHMAARLLPRGQACCPYGLVFRL